MKRKEEIETLARDYHYESQQGLLNAEMCFSRYQGFVKGYSQCQQDTDQQTKEKDLRIIDLEDKLKIINDSYLLDSVHSLNRNKELREEIERLKESKWISVEERLPEDYVPYSYTETKYLVYTEQPTGFFIEMAEWFTSDCEDVKSHFNIERPYSGYDINITHWQPLPNNPI